MNSKTTSRRQFLKETLSGVVFLSVAKLIPSEVLIAREQVPEDLLFFSSKEYLIFDAVAERIIGPASPGQIRSKDIGVATRADQFLAGADPEV